MRPPRIDRAAGRGPRLYLGRYRVHHGTVGVVVVLVGALTRSRVLVGTGTCAILHDLVDFPWRDTNNHERRTR